ncbi:MAG: hypothetical protein IIC30_00250, partial [Chloroflexi bacterium]|nr:hypothetical protein [Chloroflexota bacterium]
MPALLSARNLTKEYGETVALRDITLQHFGYDASNPNAQPAAKDKLDTIKEQHQTCLNDVGDEEGSEQWKKKEECKREYIEALEKLFRETRKTFFKKRHEAIRKWEEVVDLRSRISLGFEMVEKIAAIQPDMAREFCRRVQNLLIQPGAELAAGRLGVAFKHSILLAIQSLAIE